MQRWRLLVGLALITSSLLVACGGSGSSTPTDAKTPQAGTPTAPPVETVAQLSSPQSMTTMILESLKAAAEGKWADANKHTVMASSAPETAEPTWKAVLATYYNGDPKLIPQTRVMTVQRDGDRAKAKTVIQNKTNITIELVLKDNKWVIEWFGDIHFK